MNGKRLDKWENDVAFITHADKTMWTTLKQPNNKEKLLPFGCKTLFMSLFFDTDMMQALATSLGRYLSSSTGSLDLLGIAGRQAVDEQIELDDPFCVVISFPLSLIHI